MVIYEADTGVQGTKRRQLSDPVLLLLQSDMRILLPDVFVVICKEVQVDRCTCAKVTLQHNFTEVLFSIIILLLKSSGKGISRLLLVHGSHVQNPMSDLTPPFFPAKKKKNSSCPTSGFPEDPVLRD